MFSTLRSRLGVALGVMLLIALGLSGLLYWGTQQNQATLQRGRYAHAQLEAYLGLSLEAQRYFDRLSDWLALGAPPGRRPPLHLYDALHQLRVLTEAEFGALRDAQDRREERAEVVRIDQLEGLLRRIDAAAKAVGARGNDGLSPRAWQSLTLTLEQDIDGRFRRLIDAALADERDEVRRVEQRGDALTRRLIGIASLVSLTAVALALLLGVMLFRSVKRPLDTLLVGTTRLAAGEFGFRLAATGPAELRQLAEGFNLMSAELGRQQRRLLAAQAGLEQKVTERTRALHQANQELQRLDQTRRRFFADVSHELRTPLTVILGEAEVTLRGADRPAAEYRTVLRRIVELSGQLGRLVDDLLSLARSDSAAASAEPQTVDLDRLLRQVCANARSLARAGGQNVSLAVSDRRLQVRGDPQRLQQLLLIFIDNACRYSGPGQDIAVALESDRGDAVVVVSDGGVGIAADELERVFERSYRGVRARQLAPSGSGLGLALARAIVRAHHGTVELNSSPGSGTTVTVRLPLAARVASACVS